MLVRFNDEQLNNLVWNVSLDYKKSVIVNDSLSLPEGRIEYYKKYILYGEYQMLFEWQQIYI
jgi:hypothetical protein